MNPTHFILFSELQEQLKAFDKANKHTSYITGKLSLFGVFVLLLAEFYVAVMIYIVYGLLYTYILYGLLHFDFDTACRILV